MNNAEVNKQVQQMIRFITQEAEEKANEISVSAEEEFNIEKMRIVEAGKRRIRQEYDRKEKQLEMRKSVEFSNQLHASRLKVLQAQNDVVHAMKESAEKQLSSVSRNTQNYKTLLQGLIVQGLRQLKEESVIMRCRESDLKLIKDVLEDAKKIYLEKCKADKMELRVDENKFLYPAPDSKKEGPFCAGGVVLGSKDGRIICENTLNARLDVVFKHELPEIRRLLLEGLGTRLVL